jgi:hypothetical protein
VAFRVFTGPPGSEVLSPLEKDRSLYKEYSSLDEALAWAHHASATGHVVLLIEGDDGTVMTKQEISNALRHPERGAMKAATSK